LNVIITTDNDMRLLGERVARQLRGGECIELVGDVGAGKTTFTQGLGNGLEADDEVQSPSFTISREYACRDGLRLAHYDFYRLSDGGIMHHELAESVQDPHTITVVEWAETIAAVLPDNRIIIRIAPEPTGEARSVGIQGLTI
jgi:tRNA threonylcarbamoyladenosine biosynthesis protein TsaE